MLARIGHRVTIVERFPVLRAGGAQIDLRAQGIQLVKRMGLVDIIRGKIVDDDGLSWLDCDGTVRATFLTNKTGKGAQSFSSEFEIMRGDLVRILYDATKDNVEYIFGTTVKHFEQDDKSVTVHFSNGKTGIYDILVGADGQGSRIRKAILPPDVDPLRHLGIYPIGWQVASRWDTAHWRVPTIASDNKIGKAAHAPGGRMIMTRTHSPVESQAIFNMRDDSDELRSIPKASIEKQKEFWSSKFKDVGWNLSRSVQTWYKGRVVLVADAAHCPSPMTGMGTTSALVGTYVLAGEIAQNGEDLDKAFANYDKTLRPFVNEIQWLPGWTFPLVFPKTQLGIGLLNFVAGLVAFFRIPELLTRFSKEEKGGWKLPEYPLLNEVTAKQE